MKGLDVCFSILLTWLVKPLHAASKRNCFWILVLLLSKKSLEYRNQFALAPMGAQKFVHVGLPFLFATSRLIGSACFCKPMAYRRVVVCFASVHDVFCLFPTGLDDPVEVRLRCEGDIDHLLYEGMSCVRLQCCYRIIKQSLV